MSSGNQGESSTDKQSKPDLDLLKSLLGSDESTSSGEPMNQQAEATFWDSGSSEGADTDSRDVNNSSSGADNMGNNQSSDGQAKSADDGQGSTDSTGVHPEPVVKVVLQEDTSSSADQSTHKTRQKPRKRRNANKNKKADPPPPATDQEHEGDEAEFYIDMNSLRTESRRLQEPGEDESSQQTKSTAGSSSKGKRRRRKRPSSAPYRGEEVRDNQQVLMEKYQELRELLRNDDYPMAPGLDRQLLSQAKRKLRHYQQAQRGTVPGARLVAHPPPGPAPHSNRQRQPQHSPSRQESNATQTEVDNTGDTVLLDLTSADGTVRHVTFASGSASNNSSEADERLINKEEIVTDTPPRYQFGRPLSAPQRRARGRAPDPRTGQKPRRNTYGRELSADNARPVSRRERRRSVSSDSRSSSAAANNKRRSPSCSDSDASSRSVSRNGKEPATDHKLKNTDNQKIQTWLKQKNRLLRKKKAEERKVERSKKKIEEKEKAEKESKKTESELKVKEWMVKKKSESRLLNKRQQKSKAPEIKCANAVVIGKTIDLKTGDDVSEEVTENVPEGETGEQNASGDSGVEDRGVSCSTGADDSHPSECTCGFVQAAKLKQPQTNRLYRRPRSASARINQPDYTLRRKHPQSRRAVQQPGFVMKGRNMGPSPPKPTKGDSQEKSRMSYDQWLDQKRIQDQKAKREEEQTQALAQSDPEVNDVISEVARKRIERIKSGRRRIDTGLKKVDDEANNYPRSYDKENEVVNTYRLKSANPTEGEKRKKKRRAKSANEAGKERDGSPRRRASSPKPRVVTPASKKVMYQRQSWDEFSDYVWDKVNEDEDGDMVDSVTRPEPMGCDKTEDDKEVQHSRQNEVTDNSPPRETVQVPTSAQDETTEDLFEVSKCRNKDVAPHNEVERPTENVPEEKVKENKLKVTFDTEVSYAEPAVLEDSIESPRESETNEETKDPAMGIEVLNLKTKEKQIHSMGIDLSDLSDESVEEDLGTSDSEEEALTYQIQQVEKEVSVTETITISEEVPTEVGISEAAPSENNQAITSFEDVCDIGPTSETGSDSNKADSTLDGVGGENSKIAETLPVSADTGNTSPNEDSPDAGQAEAQTADADVA